MISYHSHSEQFCSHASGGTLELVVQTAMAKSFTSYGLSEHIPRYRQVDLYPEEISGGVDRLSTQFDAYVTEAHRLKQLYAKEIDLIVGLETEYINEEGLQRLEDLINEKGNRIEYLVGSVHHVDEQPIDFSVDLFNTLLSSYPMSSPSSQFNALFISYFDAHYTVLQRLKPEVIGHFDLCKLYHPEIDLRDYPEVWSRIIRNIKFAAEYGALFEISSAAFRKGWKTGYPSLEIFKAIQSEGGRFTLSDDSHGPALVGQNYDRVFDYLVDQDVQELYYLSTALSDVKLDGEVGRSRGVIIRKVEGKPWTNIWRRSV